MNLKIQPKADQLAAKLRLKTSPLSILIESCRMMGRYLVLSACPGRENTETISMDTTENYTSRTFLTHDKHGTEYEINVRQLFHITSHGPPTLVTAVGQTVEYLEKGKYRIVGFPFIELFCDDPDAP